MDFLLEIIMTPAVLACIKIAVIILLFAMPLGTVLTLMERKWSAMIQDRVGPNRANIGKFTGHGLLHLAADGLKSIFKEDTIPKGANGFLYLIAPFFGLIAAVATFAIIPIAGPIGDFTFQVTDVNPGLLFIFAITSLNVYGAVLAGTSSNSKFALLGGTRASAQMISYEVFMGLALMGIFMVYGTISYYLAMSTPGLIKSLTLIEPMVGWVLNPYKDCITYKELHCVAEYFWDKYSVGKVEEGIKYYFDY